MMPSKPTKAPYYTQAGLAKVAGVTRYAVWQAIDRGLLTSVEALDGTPLIPQAEAERWLGERRTRGRPRKAENKG